MVRRWLWLVAHHAVAHPLMLVLPESWSTPLHDFTARMAWPPNGRPTTTTKKTPAEETGR